MGQKACQRYRRRRPCKARLSEPGSGSVPVEVASNSALSGAPASPLGEALGPEAQSPNRTHWLAAIEGPSPQGPGPHMHVDGMNVDVHSEFSNEINDLAMHVDGHTPGRPENGAPVAAVTATHNERAHSELLGPEPPTPGGTKKGPPSRAYRYRLPQNGRFVLKIITGFKPQPGPQHHFITCPADIVVDGGAQAAEILHLGEFWCHAEDWGPAAKGLMSDVHERISKIR